MLTFYALYIVLLFVTVIVGVPLAAYAWRHRQTPGATAFVGLMLDTAPITDDKGNYQGVLA